MQPVLQESCTSAVIQLLQPGKSSLATTGCRQTGQASPGKVYLPQSCIYEAQFGSKPQETTEQSPQSNILCLLCTLHPSACDRIIRDQREPHAVTSAVNKKHFRQQTGLLAGEEQGDRLSVTD